MDELWWDPLQNPLVAMNPVRVGYIVDTLARFNRLTTTDSHRPLTGLRALDIGCGGGLLSESLARLGSEVTAIDPSTALVERAKEHAQQDPLTQTIDYRGGISVEDLAAEGSQVDKFDVICILEVVEHVQNVESLLHAAASLLHPDGVVFLSTVNRTWKSHVLCIVGAEYVMGYLPVGTHDWNSFKSPDEIQTLMKKAPLQEANVSGMILAAPPLDGKWRWQLNAKDTDVNWIGAYTRINDQ